MAFLKRLIRALPLLALNPRASVSTIVVGERLKVPNTR